MTSGSLATPADIFLSAIHSRTRSRAAEAASSSSVAARCRSQPKPCSSRAHAMLGGATRKGEAPLRSPISDASPKWPVRYFAPKARVCRAQLLRHDQNLIGTVARVAPAQKRRGQCERHGSAAETFD